jgi:hypothetical protein
MKVCENDNVKIEMFLWIETSQMDQFVFALFRILNYMDGARNIFGCLEVRDNNGCLDSFGHNLLKNA